MKILSKQQIYEGDKLTAERQKITSTELMERAGLQIFKWLHQRMQGAQVPIHVFCGIGNNGGDGLVVARHLINHGYLVKTYIVNYSDKRSKDFLVNYDLIKQTTKEWPTLLDSSENLPEIAAQDIILDAIFGIGLNRPADVWVKHIFQHFKKSKAFTLAVDIPSGLQTDTAPEQETDVVWAAYTLSFQAPKLIFFLPETAKFTVQWEILDIGIDRDYLNKITTEAELISKQEVLPVYKPRDKFSHKGSFGHALIIGGSYGKLGAAILATRSALASGAGLVSAYLPKCGYIPMQTNFPEAMVLTDTENEFISNIQFDLKPTVIGIGVGLGTKAATTEAFKVFLEKNKTALVIDADGLNILSENKDLLKLLPKNTVLTPHSKELERLIGAWKDDFDKLKKVKTLSKKHDLIIVLKGAYTLTITQEKIYVNVTGNPGLATGGTGDVLTGIITGLIAQGYNALTASIFGVYLHGKSADLVVEAHGYQSLIASHVIDGLGKAYLDLFAQAEPEPKPEENEEKTDKKTKK